MTRLVLADLRRHSAGWVWTFAVALACAVAVSSQLAVLRGASASARVAHDAERVAGAGAVAATALSLIAIAAVAVLVSTAGAAVEGRSRDVGLWRALGMRPRTAGRVLLGEVAVVGLVAGAAGSALAVPVGRMLVPLLVDEQVVLAGTSPVWSIADLLIGAVVVAALAWAGASAPVRRARRAPEAGLLRGTPDSRGRRRWPGRLVRLLLAVGATAGLVASWVAPTVDEDSAVIKVMGGGFAVFALVIIVTPWAVPWIERAVGAVAPRTSVIWHVATRTCAVEAARSSATVLPFTIAIGAAGLFFGWGAAGASGVTPAGFLSLFGPALAVAWVGGVAVIAMGADRRRRDGALLVAAGAREGQLVAVDLVEGVLHTVSAVVLGLAVTLGSIMCAGHAFGMSTGSLLGDGPWAEVAAASAATLIVVGATVSVSRWTSASRASTGDGQGVVADLLATD